MNKTIDQMTGEEFRRMARTHGEVAASGFGVASDLAERVQELASALCEAQARLDAVCDASEGCTSTRCAAWDRARDVVPERRR